MTPFSGALYLKDEHHYSPSSMRTAVAALHNFYRHLPGHEWRLFELVSAPSPRKLPAVLTRAEVARLWTVLRKDRFRVIPRLIYATGLRIGETVNLEVRDFCGGEPGFPRIHFRAGKGGKDRFVPIPPIMLGWLRAWWKTHRHPCAQKGGMCELWTRLFETPACPRRRAGETAAHTA
jgi:integrase